MALAAVLTAASGVLVGLPALRMTGVYLTIATLAFALIIQEVLRALGARDRRSQGPAGGQAGHLRRVVRRRRGVLLPVPGLPRRRALADRQPAALADGPRVGGDPRQRDRRAVDGRQPRRVQDHGLRLLGGR